MVPNDEKGVDPTVMTIVEMFPEDFGVHFLSTIRGVKRKYKEKTETTLSISSFYDQFTPELVDFHRMCVLHAIEFQA